MQVPLNESAVVTLNGSGAGTAKVGPLSAREVWSPGNVSVSCSSTSSEAQCSIYVGDAAIGKNFVDLTVSGSSGDSTDRVSATRVKTGQYVWAVWSGGTAGAVATLNVTGTKEI